MHVVVIVPVDLVLVMRHMLVLLLVSVVIVLHANLAMVEPTTTSTRSQATYMW